MEPLHQLLNQYDLTDGDQLNIIDFLRLSPAAILVFTGRAGSGKSYLARELLQYCRKDTLLIDDYPLEGLHYTAADLHAAIDSDSPVILACQYTSANSFKFKREKPIIRIVIKRKTLVQPDNL